MTKAEKKKYLEQLVASQGNQSGISISPLLDAIIADCEDVFTVMVEDNQEDTKNVTNPQAEIDAFIDAVNPTRCTTYRKYIFRELLFPFLNWKLTRTKLIVRLNLSAGITF